MWEGFNGGYSGNLAPYLEVEKIFDHKKTILF